MTLARSNFPDDDDGEVLFRLASNGIDLSVKREIDFTCWASSRRAAEEIVKDLQSYGYRSSVFIDECAGHISVYATIMMLPDHTILVAEQNRLDAILRLHSTSCDGWLTASE